MLVGEALGFTPVGWVALAIGAVIAGGAALVSSQLAKAVGDALYDVGDDIYHWMKHYAQDWF